VIVFDGIKAYRFQDGEFVKQIDLMPEIEAGRIRVEVFTGDGKDHRDEHNRTVIVKDPGKRARYEKLKALR
jgi:hypothetical protein